MIIRGIRLAESWRNRTEADDDRGHSWPVRSEYPCTWAHR